MRPTIEEVVRTETRIKPKSKLIFTLCVLWLLVIVSPAAAERPNILFILADDMGWGDASCYGNAQFKTPNIDRLAAQGVRFEQAYQAASVCSPSRAALLSGRFPAELKFHRALGSHAENEKFGTVDSLDPKSTCVLPQILKQAGYSTAHVGKWHLGDLLSRDPAAYGFDIARWVDYRSGSRNLGKLPERPDCSKILVDETISILDQIGNEPFYCQLWLLDPHAPLMPTQDQMAPFRKEEPEGFTSPDMVYAAAVTEMDRQIGRLLEYLDKRGIAENTIVVFSSDNGPEDGHAMNARWSASGSSGPFRGRKRSLYDGGTRLPFLFRWPGGGVPAGMVNKKSVISGLDLMPTLCELTGLEVPEADRKILDGESVAAAVKGDTNFQRKRPLFWERRFEVLGEENCSPRLAVRKGKWKLLLNTEDDRTELYDMEQDAREGANVAAGNPEIVETLRRELVGWKQSLPSGPVDPRAGRRYGDY